MEKIFFLVTLIATACLLTLPAEGRYINDDDSEVATLMEYVYRLFSNEFATTTAAISPTNYRCTQKSSSTQLAWSTGSPSVFLSHIFCGQVTRTGKAQGYHSEAAKAINTCVRAGACSTLPDGNNQCSTVSIRNSKGSYITKPGGSSLFSLRLSTAALTKHIQNIFNNCGKKAGTTCAQGCNYRGNTKKFDIHIQADSTAKKVISAYPKSFCNTGNTCTGQCKDL